MVRKLVESGLKGLIYNGDVDTACNYLGDEWFAEGLGFNTLREFEPWLVNSTGQVGGFVKIFDGFAYTTIRGSGTFYFYFILSVLTFTIFLTGHMVPQDKGLAALQMFNKFLES